MVPMTFTQWLAVNKNNGAVATGPNIKKFVSKYVAPEIKRLQNKAHQLYWTSNAEDLKTNCTQAVQQSQFPQAQALLDQLVNSINTVCGQLNEKDLLASPVARYATENGWETEIAALQAMDALAIADNLPTRQPSVGANPSLPGIKWSTAKQNLPINLANLIRDIRNASRSGGFVDERDQQQRNAATITPKAPATLRSWHMNDQGSLPAIPRPVPQAALHMHYTATSQAPGNTPQQAQAPIGYAEYTGCGIRNDAHNVKLVLDYTNNDVYVTVTHYMRWNKLAGPPVVYQVGSKVSGDYSAWFYIDFAQ